MKGPLFADEENTKLAAGKAVMKLALPSASWDARTILSGIVIFLEIADYISMHYFFFYQNEKALSMQSLILQYMVYLLTPLDSISLGSVL